MEEKKDVVIYHSDDGLISMEALVDVEHETIWASQKAIANLFGVNSQAITKHLQNIYEEEELLKATTCSKKEQVRKEGTRTVTRAIEFYNLDAIISVGYRVNSVRATKFRIWATGIIKQYMIKGYAINRDSVSQQKYEDLKRAVNLLENVFSKDLLMAVITDLKGKFGSSDLFGVEKDKSFHSSIGQIYQTWDGKDLYPSIEEKAAMLLYLVVKNHSFIDGNKRIAATLFLWFLQNNDILYRPDGTKRIADASLVALTLMIAESPTDEMDTMVKVVVSLINRRN